MSEPSLCVCQPKNEKAPEAAHSLHDHRTPLSWTATVRKSTTTRFDVEPHLRYRKLRAKPRTPL